VESSNPPGKETSRIRAIAPATLAAVALGLRSMSLGLGNDVMTTDRCTDAVVTSKDEATRTAVPDARHDVSTR
jgi:hypothetical protein